MLRKKKRRKVPRVRKNRPRKKGGRERRGLLIRKGVTWPRNKGGHRIHQMKITTPLAPKAVTSRTVDLLLEQLRARKLKSRKG